MVDEPNEVSPSLLERKLVTILSADVAEYSRLMAEDEEQTLRVFRQYSEIFGALVDSHHGRIFNTAGDAILAEFVSPVEAVRCATDIQAALRTCNDQLPPARQVKFRIGVNLGDVMKQNSDLMGDGVNVAARLQGAAEPGGICLSGSVYDQIRNKLSLSFESLGERRYKNIPQLVRTFAISETENQLPAAKTSSGNSRGWVAAGVAVAALLLVAGGYWAYTTHLRSQADHSSVSANVLPAGEGAVVSSGKPANMPTPVNTVAKPAANALEIQSGALLADAVRAHRPQQEIQALADANAKIAALATHLHELGTKPGEMSEAASLTAQMKSLATDMSRNEAAALARTSRTMERDISQPPGKAATPDAAAAIAAATQAKVKLDDAVAAVQQAPDETASLAAARQAIAAFDVFNTAYAAAARFNVPARRNEIAEKQPEGDTDNNVPSEIFDQIKEEKAADTTCWDATKANPSAAAGSEVCSRRDKLVAELKIKGWCGKARGDVGVLQIWNKCP